MTGATQHPTDRETSLNEQLDSYVDGTADEAQTLRIEEALISDPALAAQLDVRQRIKGGLQLLEQRGQLAALVSDEAGRRGFRRVALAASVLVALVAAASILLTLRTEPTAGPVFLLASALDGREVTRSVVLARTRGEAQTIEARKDDQVIQLRLFLGEEIQGPLRATLRLPGDSGGTHAVDLAPASGGFAEVYLDLRSMAEGRHSIQLLSSGKPVETYEFDLRYKR